MMNKLTCSLCASVLLTCLLRMWILEMREMLCEYTLERISGIRLVVVRSRSGLITNHHHRFRDSIPVFPLQINDDVEDVAVVHVRRLHAVLADDVDQ